MIDENLIEEISQDGERVDVKVSSLKPEMAKIYIDKVLKTHSPVITSAHLLIGGKDNPEILEISSEYEFTYSECLPEEPIYVFFDQTGKGQNTVIRVENGRNVGKLEIFDCYFLSNETADYLIAVNEYGIQYKGDNPEWFNSLERTKSSN